MKLSHLAWEKTLKITDAIKAHSFNARLMNGTLAKDKFAYYIEQDSIYLNDFARSLAIIASKIEIKHVRKFLSFSDHTFIAEQEIVHKYFKDIFKFKETGTLTTATIAYTNFLLARTLCDSVEIGVAAVLPCFWVYLDVGQYIAKNAEANNPYSRWIATYASDEFEKSVREVIAIFDELAQNSSTEIRAKMLEVFEMSCIFEWRFWNDAYNLEKYNSLIQVP